MGRVAMGVRGIRLRPNDTVVGMDVVTDKDQRLIVLSRNGYGKITKAQNVPTHRRGGVGVKVAAVTNKTGPLITVNTLDHDAKEFIVVSTGGQTIRTALKGVPVLNRVTQGVRIMKLADKDTVASLGIIPEDTPEVNDIDGSL